MEDFKETFNFLKIKKENYLDELKEHNDFNTKLRGTKNSENEIEDLFKKADSKNELPFAFKQQHNVNLLKKKRGKDLNNVNNFNNVEDNNDKNLPLLLPLPQINKDLPFSQNENVSVMNL